MAAIAAVIPVLSGCGDLLAPRIRPGTLPDSTPTIGGRPPSTALAWVTVEPRVITLGRTDSVRITARVNGTAALRGILRTGNQIQFIQNGQMHEAIVPVGLLLSAYQPGDHHHLGLQLNVDGEPGLFNLGLNIKNAAIPAVTIRELATHIQISDHVINLRSDSTSPGNSVPAALIREVYRYFLDEFDFIALLDSRRSPRNRLYQGVRNDINGIGLVRYDHGPTFGSEDQLQGMIIFPNDDQFDLAETSNLHEIAHRWMNFTQGTSLFGAAPHWPLSDLAYGVMGRQDPATNQGIEFPFRLVETAGGFRADRIDRAAEFNDLELYLMGLVSTTSVRQHIVFRDQSLQVQPNAILPGPVDTVRIADIVAANGARSPSAAVAQRDFRIATVVLSRGRLLTPDEMAFFDHMAARGASENVLQYTQGLQRGETKPFYLATGQRARLITTVR